MPSAILVDGLNSWDVPAVDSSSTSSLTPLSLTTYTGHLNFSNLEIASKILSILSRYRLDRKNDSIKAGEGNLKFLAQLYHMVNYGKAIRMCLPAFPFKSPNSISKVLGRLPDKAEEFALAHLNGLCSSIQDIYQPGAKLMIISDGLVYNDLLGVPDRDVWAYGEALRKLTIDKEFNNIEFSRLKDLVNIDLPDKLGEITYVANATNFRHALLQNFSTPGYNVSTKIAESEDTCLTYRGYIKFLETDLANVYPIGNGRSKSEYKRGVEYTAKQMLTRGEAFARAVRERFPDHLRLSIHASAGDKKLSIGLLPTDTYYTTPWHCTIAFRLDGTTTTGPRSEFDNNPSFELVYENDQPSYFREKTDLLSWATEKGGIICEPLYPAGLMIKPAAGPGKLTIHDIDAIKVRALSEIQSPVVLRGFENTGDRELFIQKAHELGTPTPWKFGLVLEVKDRGTETRGLNNVLSAEWMPWHFDGLFKTETRIREETGEEYLWPTPPKIQFFTAVTASPKNTGFTLFATSPMIWKYLPAPLTIDYLRNLTWSVSTSSFNSSIIRGLPLIQDHPHNSQPCLRYHEPWPQSKTAFEATNVMIDNVTTEVEGKAVCDALTALLHDRRVALYHTWEKGDLLVSDNVLAMHTRSDFTAGCDRELWRIHVE